jgi:hypothetical protein
LFVFGKLSPPELQITLWPGCVPGAAVPEAAIHKHSEFDLSKNEVRLARPTFPKTLREFRVRFAAEDDCYEHLIQFRWPDGIVSPPLPGVGILATVPTLAASMPQLWV